MLKKQSCGQQQRQFWTEVASREQLSPLTTRMDPAGGTQSTESYVPVCRKTGYLSQLQWNVEIRSS
jgi:hypothetical protein